MAITLRDQYTANTGDDQARLIAEQAAAENMGSLRRGYEAGRIGTDINANLIDEASLRSAGRTAETDALAVQTRAAQARQAMYAPRVGRVEDISGVGDALSWAGTQIGQGVASMQDPVALTAAGTALGRLPGLRRLAPIAGAIGAFGLNQRQMAGEHYGNLREDPTAMTNLGAQGAYRQANTVGVLGGALDTVLPGMAGRALGGAALTRGAAGMLGRNTGTKALGGTVLEGATEVGQGELGRTAIGMVNPDRDTSGDASARLNEFAGGAVGGAPFSVAGAMADSAYGRTARAGELVKEKAGEVVDLTKEKAPQIYEDSGIKGVVDLGMQGGKSVLDSLGKVGKAAQDYMRDASGKINYAEGIKRAQADVERFKLSQEEADLLTAVPPAEADPDTLATWTEQNYADRTNYVFGKLEALERDGVQEATGFLDALESDDPVARTQAVDEATSFLLERNAAAQVRERATLFQAAIGEFIQKGAARMTRGAKAAGDAAAFAGLNVAEGVKQGLEGKKNMQGAGFSTLDYDTWKAWRDQNSPPLGEDSQRAHAIQKAVEGRSRLKELREKPLPVDPEAAKRSYERATLFGEMLAAEAAARRAKVMGHRVDEADGVIDYTNYVRSLAYEVEDMANSWAGRAGAGTRPTGTDTRQAGVALGLVDSMAEDLNNVLGPAAGDVVARMAQSAEPTAKAFFDVLQERVAGRQATMAERKVQDQTLQDQMLALLPQEHQAALREDGGAGARNLQQTAQMIARGRVPPTKRREIEKAIGAGTLNRMLSLYGETVAPETQVGTVVDDTGNEEIQNADMLTVTDDGEVDPNARIDDFEKRQAERKAARNSAPRMYAFYGEKAQSLRTTDSERRTARNPFEPLKRMSPSEAAKAREAAAAAELAGEGGKPVIPNARPRLLRMDAEGAAEGIANKIGQLEKTLGVDRTPENFFRLAKEELKGVAQTKKRESLAALEKAYAEGDEAAQTRVAEMMERFFETRAGDYVVNAVSAKQVMDELGMPLSQRLAIFRDYMFQEGHRAREKDPAASKRFYALARNAQAQLLDGGFEPSRGAAAENADTPVGSGIGVKRNVARLSAGERRTLQTAMERYFGEGYLVAAEQLSDRVPGTMAVGELLEMARKGNQAREAVRGDANKSGSDTVANAARAELEGSLLNFPQRAGVNLLGTKDATTLSIKASNLVAWVRNNRREDGADTKSDGKTKLGEEAQFLRDLQEGIATITNMDAIDGLPYVVGPDGEKQRFTDRGVPDALQLPNRAGWSFNRGKAERVAKAAGKDAPEPRSQMEVANDQMRSDDWFVTDPLEGATDNVKYTTFEEPKNKDAGVGTSPAVRRTVFADRDTDAQHAPVNRQANRDDADVSPLDTKLFLDAGQAEYDDQKLRSKDAGEGVGRESAMDAVKRAEERAGSIVVYTGPGREVTEGGTLTRVDRDIDARATLTNIQRRVIAARLGGLKGLERELTPKEAALQKEYDGFASGKHYAYPLAHALSVKNVQDLLDSGAFSPAQMDFLVDQQRMAAQIINTAPAGVRLQLAKAMMDGRGDVTNYGQAGQALTALAKGVSYKSAAPEVAAAGAPKSQPKPGGVKLSGKTPFTPKDQAKADRATKFIGRGSERSSTALYAKDFGALANTGSYTTADTVFVSAEGVRAGRLDPDFKEIDKAIAARATIITDNATSRDRDHNIGERQVAAHLLRSGYVERAPGEWGPSKLKHDPYSLDDLILYESGGVMPLTPEERSADYRARLNEIAREAMMGGDGDDLWRSMDMLEDYIDNPGLEGEAAANALEFIAHVKLVEGWLASAIKLKDDNAQVVSRLSEGTQRLGQLLRESSLEMTDAQRAVVKAVTKIAPDTKVQEGPVAGIGEYDTKGNTITVNVRDGRHVAATVLLHEGVHAATAHALTKDKELKAAGEALMAHSLEAAPWLKRQYGFTNVFEFVAEAMSNPALQGALKEIKPSAQVKSMLAGRNLWDSFLTLVYKALGISRDSDALAQSIAIGAAAMRTQRPESATAKAAAFHKERQELLSGKAQSSRVDTTAERITNMASDPHAQTALRALRVATQSIARSRAGGVAYDQAMTAPGVQQAYAELGALRLRGSKTAAAAMRSIQYMAEQHYALPVPNRIEQMSSAAVAKPKATLQQALEPVLQAKDVPTFVKVLAKAVTKVAGQSPIHHDSSMTDGHHGEYNTDSGVIRINPVTGTVATVVHEGAHAATVAAITQDAGLHRAIYDLMDHVLTQRPELANAYGMTNSLEFLAEGLSNQSFQERLKQIKASDGVRKYLGETVANAWDAFVNLIRKALNLAPEHESALSQFLELSGRAMYGTSRASARGAGKVKNLAEFAERPVVSQAEFMRRVDELMAAPEVQEMSPFTRDRLRLELARFSDKSGASFAATLGVEAVRRHLTAMRRAGLVSMENILDTVVNAGGGQGPLSLPSQTVTMRNAQDAGKYEGWKNGPQARAARGMATDADLKAAREYFDRVLGKQVKAEFENITGYSGEFIEADNLIKVSTLTNAGVMNVARHEALHAFFSKFVKSNPKAVKVLPSLTNNERVLRRLQTLLKDEPAALEQLVDGEERLAYIYQFAMAGQLRLPHTPGTTLMHKVRKFLRRVFQMVSDDERAVDLLYAFEHGKMSDPSAGARAMAKVLDQGTWMTKGARSIDAVTQRAAAWVLPANTILAESISPTARALAKQFFTNPGEEGAAEGGKGYLNARNEQMRQYDNLFRKAIDKLDKRQLDELTEAMQNETPTGDVRDPDVAAAKEQLHALFERFHRYLTEEKGLRIGKINEGYFPVVYDVDKVREGGLEKLLSGKYIGEINKMAAAINDKRASKNPDAEMVSSDDVISAIVNHITRDNPLDDAELEPQRQDGVLRPWFASGERRVLDFLSPEDRAQLQEKDIIKTVSRYVRQGVRTAEYSSRFGRTGALLDRQLDKIQGELEAASREMLAAGDLKNEKAREKWVKRQYRDVANAVGGMEGSLGSDVSEGVRKINSWSIVYQNVRLLPLALFSSFVDPLGIVARGGEMREAFTTFTEGIKGVARQWSDAIREEPADRQKSRWEELAEHAGVIDTATFSHLLADEYGSVYLDGTTKKINEVMFKANGMEAWNRAMRVGATRSAVRFMERHNKAPTEHSARWMKDLGFEPGTLPLDSEGRLITDKRVMMSENPDMKMEEAEAKIAKVHSAINRWVEGAILSPNAAQRPAWGSDPHFSLFWHLKQFAYSFHETIMKRALNEAKHGNVMPLGVFAWYIPTMIAADVTKGLMLGAGELPAYMKGYDLGDWMLHGVERSGVLGIGQVAIDGVQDPTGLAGPAVEQITDIFVQPMEQNIVKALPVNALYSRALL